MLLRELVRTWESVAAAPQRRVKIAELASILRQAGPAEVPIVVCFLSGELRQRQIGVGYAALASLADGAVAGQYPERRTGAERPDGAQGPDGAERPDGDRPGGAGPAAGALPGGERRRGSVGAGPGPAGLTVTETDEVFAAIGAVTGTGAQAARKRLLADLFARATEGERRFLIRLLAGDLRQGALTGVMVEALAQAAGVPSDEVRRAHLLGGSLPVVAQAALAAAGERAGPGGIASPGGTAGPGRMASADSSAGSTGKGGAASGAGGPAVPASPAAAASAALRAFGLRVGRPLRPMLAASAPTVAAAMDRVSPAAVEWKIDGIRVQVHREGSRVWVFTRTLDDITARVPELTEAVLALGVRSLVLDGEAVALRADGRPHPFQVTAGRAGSQADVAGQRAGVPLTPYFFDLLHLDGEDLIDAPASHRYAELSRVLPASLVIPRLVTGDVTAAERFFAGAVARGHEGVLVKSPAAGYAAGRRGAEWIKVKPRHTLDLVVLAAEWGHGRRRGWLSNLHLAARDPATGGLVMLGKTFKGLTDQMLTWQTERLLELAGPGSARPSEDHRQAYGVLRVRPELVVEVAFDGVQASSRYPGGLALRFARVLRHRPDKPASEADTIDAVRALWTGDAAGHESDGDLA